MSQPPDRNVPGTIQKAIEFVSPRSVMSAPRVAVFDFDGTLSVIREGWQEIMIPMMVEGLLEVGTKESREELELLVADFVMELTGKPTIYQMIRFQEELASRGNHDHEADFYLAEFQARLGKRIHLRKQAIRDGSEAPSAHRIPFVVTCLERLQAKGTRLYVLSGTDQRFVSEEVGLLGLSRFFEDRIFGPTDDPQAFSKEGVIRQILAQENIAGDQLVSYGDGVVEIAATIAVDGIAIGIAGDERARDGRVDEWKRQRLIEAGAHVIMPDFREHKVLESWLFGLDGSID